jgi:hypothetical protein
VTWVKHGRESGKKHTRWSLYKPGCGTRRGMSLNKDLIFHVIKIKINKQPPPPGLFQL